MGRELVRFAELQRGRLAVVDDEVAGIVDAALDFVGGGKLLRPLFCYAGWLIAGGAAGDERIARAASAFEWLQGSALVHDDLMDGSDTRRGRPSVHRAFEQAHRREGRIGDAERFGGQVAVLLGDLMLSWADDVVRSVPQEEDWHLPSALGYWDLAKTEVIAGQYLDVVAQTRDRLDAEDALRVVRFKSAKYTVERPLHVGAALAGASPELIDGLSAVALPLGEAFQLRDDILGVFGDPSTTGKPAGDDLREGKRTVLIARTAERDDPQRLFSLLGRDDTVAELTMLIDRSGARADVEADIARLEARSDAALAALGEQAVAVLGPLARATTRRVR